MIIRTLKEMDIIVCSELISRTFKTCNYNEGFKRAAEDYIDFYNIKTGDFNLIKKSFKRTPYAFVCELNGQIIGVIRGTRNQLINLFVDINYHKRGVGSELLKKYENAVVIAGSDYIKIKASLYGTLFYEKAGYKKSTGIRNFRGLKIQPMKKLLINNNTLYS